MVSIAQAFTRYTAVGVFSTTVHYVILAVWVDGWGWPAWLGSGVGAVVGAQVGFVGNRFITFAHRGAIGTAWRKFMTTALLGTLLGMAIVAALTPPHGLGWHYLWAQAVATAVVLVVGFAMNRWWTFNAAQSSDSSGSPDSSDSSDPPPSPDTPSSPR